jgi:hypothetical protein
MNKTIPTTIGILIIVLVAGVAGASVLFFNQKFEEESFVETDEIIVEDDLEISKNNIIEKDYVIIEKVPRGGGGRVVKIKEREGDWNTVIIEEFGFELDYPKEWELLADVGSPIGFEIFFDEDLEEHCSINILCGGQIMGHDDEQYGENQKYFYGDYEEELLCRAILSTNLRNETLLGCQNILKEIVSSVNPIE